MKKIKVIMSTILLAISVNAQVFLPGPKPGPANIKKSGDKVTISNKILTAEMTEKSGVFVLKSIKYIPSGEVLDFTKDFPEMKLNGQMYKITDFKVKSDSKVSPAKLNFGVKGQVFRQTLTNEKLGLDLIFSVELGNEANYIREKIQFLPKSESKLESLTFFNLMMKEPQKTGNVVGSPVAGKNSFVGFEHPLARTQIDSEQITGTWSIPITLKEKGTQEFNAVFGFYSDNQLRRSFSYYLERERGRAYRNYLHYNSWFDLNISNGKSNQMNSKEAEASITVIGEELHKKRGMRIDGFVMDDGWDYHAPVESWDPKKRVWDFNSGFQNGFKEVKELAFDKYKAGIGVWLSPFGGYGGECGRRLSGGSTFNGFETRGGVFAVSGKNYNQHFTETCLNMMKKFKVNYFKFDRMGGNDSTGNISGADADDIIAVLNLNQALRKQDKDVFINATVGTWPSPFWMMFADSIWRQGQDAGWIGDGDGRLEEGYKKEDAGNQRERWISYRDYFVKENILKNGSLYPTNSLMFHGVVIGDRSLGNIHPRLNEDGARESIRNEIRMAFAGGCQLQELYITPRLLTKENWDDIAEAANWSHKNDKTLIDSHWIGGSPTRLEIYGYAAWTPKKSIIVLRNPRNIAQKIKIDLVSFFELPKNMQSKKFIFGTPFKDQRVKELKISANKPIEIELNPFEVMVLETR